MPGAPASGAHCCTKAGIASHRRSCAALLIIAQRRTTEAAHQPAMKSQDLNTSDKPPHGTPLSSCNLLCTAASPHKRMPRRCPHERATSALSFWPCTMPTAYAAMPVGPCEQCAVCICCPHVQCMRHSVTCCVRHPGCSNIGLRSTLAAKRPDRGCQAAGDIAVTG